jgi:hypothetical protein
MFCNLFYKKFTQTLFIALLSFLYINRCQAQNIVNTQNQKEKIFLVRTKQFNEFLDRFNYETGFDGKPVDSLFKSKLPRNKMLASLFDLRDVRTDRSDKNWSQNYSDLKAEFINTVMHETFLIDKYSEKIIAEARSRITFNGVPSSASIFLTQEIVGKGMVKWVITNVRSDIFNFYRPDTAHIRFISPSSNETDFINLKRALEDIDHLRDYTTKDYYPDNLAVFLFLVHSGAIKLEFVEEVTYHILDIPGWYIKVKEFNRLEMNSGWLICDIKKNNMGLTDYLKSLRE